MVLIPKGGGDYRNIHLVEVVWKAVAVILNSRSTVSITYHNYIHGFRSGHDMGTGTLEVKLLQQVTAMREEVLHTILLDLHKDYDALDRSRCLKILEGYGVGHRALLLLLRRYWERLQMVARAGGYYGETSSREIGMTQGDPLSPTIFNGVVDAVIHHLGCLILEGAGGGGQQG